ncbi:hypothetical protein Acr_23g0011970 [Actinidia rufa]|uniref:Uncharacterized protein n=1 Tax=Actinidia rufa TaxID=165716 RepID=A0A7J0GPU0_9ERIC|nr:hypothetical protein Acr_23g0011970 [Actinidia rufa]
MDHFFPASEEEVIGVEHLLAEPKCNNLGDDVLGFNTLSQHTGFNFEDFSTVGSGSIKTDNDALDSSLNRSKKVKEVSITRTNVASAFPNGMVGGVEAMVLDRKSNLSDTCEDYLLDTEFVDEASDFNLIKGSYTRKLGPESESTGSVGRECGDERSESDTVRFPVLQASFQDSSLLDKMTIDELHEAFRNMFGCETAVTDQQWLKSHLSFGLQNLLVPSDENEGKMISPVSDQCSRRVFSPSTGVFNFKKKPRRVQHVRRERHENHASLKALSSDDRRALFGFSELIEQENALITSKRSRKPPRRYIEESLEQNSRHRKRRHGISNTCSRDKILHNGSYKQHNSKGREAKTFVCQKVPFKGACIQVPFGQPVCRKQLTRKVHESDNCKASRLLGSNVDSDMESFSTKSQDDAFEDDYSTGTRKGKSRRKNHMYWSVSEVLKLVEGVSNVWSWKMDRDKKAIVPFISYPHIRQMEKSSAGQLPTVAEQQRGGYSLVESRKKHGSQSIPLSILHRVRELAVIYPYPRERKTQVSQTTSVASPIPGTSTSCDNLLPLSTAVRV